MKIPDQRKQFAQSIFRSPESEPVQYGEFLLQNQQLSPLLHPSGQLRHCVFQGIPPDHQQFDGFQIGTIVQFTERNLPFAQNGSRFSLRIKNSDFRRNRYGSIGNDVNSKTVGALLSFAEIDLRTNVQHGSGICSRHSEDHRNAGSCSGLREKFSFFSDIQFRNAPFHTDFLLAATVVEDKDLLPDGFSAAKIMTFFCKIPDFTRNPCNLFAHPGQPGRTDDGRFVFRIEIRQEIASAPCGIRNDTGPFQVLKTFRPRPIEGFSGSFP